MQYRSRHLQHRSRQLQYGCSDLWRQAQAVNVRIDLPSNFLEESAWLAKPSWNLALTLSERATFVRGEDLRALTSDLGRRRFRRWINTPGFQNPATLAHFLESQGLDEQTFLAILSEPPRTRPGEVPAFWVNELASAMSDSTFIPADDLSDDSWGFLCVVTPLIRNYIFRLKSIIRSLNDRNPNSIKESEVVISLYAGLAEQLTTLLLKTAILELNIARIEHRLAGSNPAERFEAFLNLLRTPEYRKTLLSLYPGLARLCVRACQQWLCACNEFLDRRCNDHARLSEVFGCTDLGTLVSAEFAASDSHQQGRRVIFASFGCGLQIVYKPRPQAISAAFQSFVSLLNEWGQLPKLRPLAVMDCDGYGWMEFVEHGSCRSENEVADFYRRAGGLLAILYVLGGTDCHFQNVIASGADPVVVDVETLFEPQTEGGIDRPESDALVSIALRDSVLRVGLLPTPNAVGGKVGDMSGIGAGAFERTSLETSEIQAEGTDEARIARVSYLTGKTYNRAILNGSTVDIGDQIGNVEDGFTSTYQIILGHQSELLAPDGPLTIFESLPVRVVLRPTAAYSALLAESLHPKALQDEIGRERVLSQIWSGTDLSPALRRVVSSEYSQMLNGDIPYFSTMPGSTSVVSGDGKQLGSLIQQSGITLAVERVARMGQDDLVRHRWLIDASTATLKCDRSKTRSTQTSTSAHLEPLEIAVAIGARLDELAIRGDKGVSWLTVSSQGDSVDQNNYSIELIGNDLYGGLAGLSLFMFYLADAAPQERFQQLANRTLSSLEAHMPNLTASASLGAFDGLAGLIYLYSHAGAIQGDPTMIDRAVGLLPFIRRLIVSDVSFDLISGSAGCIPCLLSLHSERPESIALELAEMCGNHLIASILSKRNVDKVSLLRHERGFSHGYSGLAWALAELWSRTQETRFLAAARDFLRLEDSLLEGDQWTDPLNAHFAGQASWCHGPPGMWLARLAIFRLTRESDPPTQSEAFLESLRTLPGLGNHSLCHGDLGNLEVLFQAAELLPDDYQWLSLARKAECRILDDIGNHGWRSATPNNIDTPSLMTGISGIGLALLRLHDRSRTPTPLLLAPPRRIRGI